MPPSKKKKSIPKSKGGILTKVRDETAPLSFLKNRLKLLVGEQSAGNNSPQIANELSVVISALHRLKAISTSQAIKLQKSRVANV